MSIAAAAAVGAAISGCSLVAGVPETEPPQFAESSIGHIHGLGISDSGDLFVATHTGVYRLPSGTRGGFDALEGPIANNAQDTMGFTMVDGTMFGSGHPDPTGTQSHLPSLGLITSTDEAQTWEAVSLTGEADFHDIAAVQNSTGGHDVYAYDATAGSVQTSRDSGKSWAQGATISARDLTFDTASSTLYATTEDGVATSTDGGTTFVSAEGPALYLAEALNDGSGRLVGTDVSGAVWLKSPEGTWQETGKTSGQVAALAVRGGAQPLLVTADARGVSTSEDFGATWQTLVTRTP
ncbi:WD40/YVTN/BNR-like repeat-containing protein [Marisediminicola senii]|uniref:WD40/YVTN/BNR-like repeat-containing protein n=1 Tax=Marisediminicola senii TaxID=2711233 RepID=UPI0013EC6580|nr:hypothetical protein [Marisediminicola senii]